MFPLFVTRFACHHPPQMTGGPAMRWGVSIGAVLVAGAMAGGGIAAPNPVTRLADKETVASVDVELVLAVDVS